MINDLNLIIKAQTEDLYAQVEKLIEAFIKEKGITPQEFKENAGCIIHPKELANQIWEIQYKGEPIIIAKIKVEMKRENRDAICLLTLTAERVNKKSEVIHD